MASRTARLVLAATLALSSYASVAHADPSAADKETARSMMNEGRAARDKGDLKGAVKAFAAADSLMHVPTTGLELAKAQVAVGQLVEARDTALRITRIPVKDGEPAPFKAARDAASTLNDELVGRIPSLTVNVKNVPDGMTPTVTIDGADVPAEVLGHPRKVDPGHHVIAAKAGTADGKQEIDVAEKETKDVSIELPAQSAAPPPPAGDETKPGGDQPPESTGSSGNKLLIFGGFGLAGAGVIAGSITGLLAMSKANSIKGNSNCQSQNGNTVCNPAEDSDISSGKSMATISTVSFIVAGVGAAIGVVGFFVGGGDSAPAAKPADAPAADQSSARIIPWIGIGSAGINGTF
jgi:hypothetical protein